MAAFFPFPILKWLYTSCSTVVDGGVLTWCWLQGVRERERERAIHNLSLLLAVWNETSAHPSGVVQLLARLSSSPQWWMRIHGYSTRGKITIGFSSIVHPESSRTQKPTESLDKKRRRVDWPSAAASSWSRRRRSACETKLARDTLRCACFGRAPPCKPFVYFCLNLEGAVKQLVFAPFFSPLWVGRVFLLCSFVPGKGRETEQDSTDSIPRAHPQTWL